ncbi:MAG: hypothetical protein JW931_07180 [Methanomicrobiaceae archaeon]|nr:hypothetical protein [Methanomicrobiaceae archaeon]
MKKIVIIIITALIALSTFFFIIPVYSGNSSYNESDASKYHQNPDAKKIPEENVLISGGETAVPESTSCCEDCCYLAKSGDSYYGVMVIDDEYRQEKMETILSNPVVSGAADNPLIEETIFTEDVLDYSGEGKYLNGYVPYFGSSRDQGLCGNCWVWSCTEVAEIEYAVKTGKKERFSVQYFNSNYNNGQGSGAPGSWACCGGNMFYFSSFYNQDGHRKLVPWSNTKAGYYDLLTMCPAGASNMQAALISEDPSVTFDSIKPFTVQTWGVSKSEAINVVESYIDQGKALYISFEWVNGHGFDQWWSSGYRESMYDPVADKGSGTPDSSHAVTLIGYNESAWLLHNSWGTPSNHPDGTFWMKKDFDYSAGNLIFASDTYVNFYGFDITGLKETAPEIIREYTYGGTANDLAYGVSGTSDGGYIFAGEKSSSDGKYPVNYGASDIWMVKTNSSGSVEWERIYGGSGSESAKRLLKTTDGGFLVAGSTSSNDMNVSGNKGGSDALLMKTDRNGVLQWLKVYGGSDDECFNDIVEIAGGYIAAGGTKSSDGDVSSNNGGEDSWIVTVDTSGSLIRGDTYGGSADESIIDIILPGGGTLLASGSTMSSDGDVSSNNGGKDAWIIKTDLSGNLLWENTYGGSADERALGIGMLSDGSFIAAGSAESSDGDVSSNNGGDDVWLFGINSTGALFWEKNYGGTGDDVAVSVLVLDDDCILLSAATESTDGDIPGINGGTDVWLIKTGSSGDALWTGCYGGQEKDLLFELVPSSSPDGFFAGGSSFSSDGDVSSNNGGGDLWIVEFGYSAEDPIVTPDPTVTPSPVLNVTPTPTKVNNITKVSGEPSSTTIDLQAIIQDISKTGYKRNSGAETEEQEYNPHSAPPIYVNAETVIGGTGDDLAVSVIPGFSSGYIVAGATGSYEGDLISEMGGMDIVLAAFNSELELDWKKCMGGSGEDIATSLVKSDEGQLIITGTTSSSDGDIPLLHGENDIFIACTDSIGSLRWVKTVGGSLDDRASSMTTTYNGNIIVVGETWSSDGDVSFENKRYLGGGDLWVVCFDSSGNLLWDKRLGGSGYDRASAVVSTPDGGCTIAGETWSLDGDPLGNNNKIYGKGDIWVIRLDTDGRLIWQKVFGTSGDDGATDIELLKDGGYIISGYAGAGDNDAVCSYGEHDAWVIKIDSSGKLLWEKSYGSSSSDLGMDVECCSNRDFIIAGVSFSKLGDLSAGGDYDGWLIKLDPLGSVLWEKSFGGSGEDWGNVICPAEGEYIIAGITVNPNDQKDSSDSDLWLIKIDD